MAPSRWRPHRVALAAGTALGIVATVLLAIGPIDRYFEHQVESLGPQLSSVEPPLRPAPGAVQTDEPSKTAASPPDSAALTQPETTAAAPGASTTPVPAETIAAAPAATAGDDRRPPEAREGATAQPAPDRPQAATAATGPPPSAPPPLDERGRAGPAPPKEARNIPVPYRTPEWRLHAPVAASTPPATAASAAADEPGGPSEQPAPADESVAAPTAPAAVAPATEDDGSGARPEAAAAPGASATPVPAETVPVPAETVARALRDPWRHALRGLLAMGEQEGRGFALYSYVLFNRYSLEGLNFERRRAAVSGFVTEVDPLDVQQRLGLADSQVNAFYLPVEAKPSPEVTAQTPALIDHIMKTYDIARARRMVERLGLDGDGPFLVALLQPLSAPAEIDRDRLLVYDLSGVPPGLICLWIAEFKRQTARAEYWQHDLRHLALLLRTSITKLAEAFSATQEAQAAIVIEPFR